MNSPSLALLSGSTATLTPKDLAYRAIDELYAKYAHDDQLFAKMHNYVCFRLPTVIENMKRVNDERRKRNEQLSEEQDAFIQAFLTNNQYFYCHQTDRFFFYNKLNYSACREDDVLHHILTTITREWPSLIPRKPQTKVYIMKRVKETPLFQTIPESATIQSVMDALSPALFNSKSEVKYFLTVLGDHLLKKTDDTNHSYFASTKSKLFLRELATAGQSLFGVHPTGLFKHKYHGHGYKTIRLIKLHDTVGVESIWRPILNKHVLDIFCVATHYSHRYSSADQYLDHHADDVELVQYALYFRGKTAKDVVQAFMQHCMVVKGVPGADGTHLPTASSSSSSSSHSGEDVMATSEMTSLVSVLPAQSVDYLWRKFLRDKALPHVLTTATVLELLETDLLASHYDREKNLFRGISSPFLNAVHQFNRFWEMTMRPLDKATTTAAANAHKPNSTENLLPEYEIDEIVMMYREWCGANYSNTFRINDAQMLDLIRTYKPVEIVDDKYVRGVECTLWDKPRELHEFFAALTQQHRSQLQTSITTRAPGTAGAVLTEDPRLLSIYDAYAKYQEWVKRSSHSVAATMNSCNNNIHGSSIPSPFSYKQTIGKPYFDKYVYTVLKDMVVDEQYISMQ